MSCGCVHTRETGAKLGVPTVTVMDVALVRWPDEESTRTLLRTARRPRILLIRGTATPPEPEDPLEDWVRMPIDDADLRARMRWLEHRVDHLGPHDHSSLPTIDHDGLMRVGERWVALPPVELRLARAMLDRLGAVVSREGLARAGWPEGAPGRNALDVHVLRLRRRLAPLDLAIHTVRSRGYLMALTGGPSDRSHPSLHTGSI